MSLTIPVQEIVTESNDPLLAIHQSWERVPLGTIAKILNGFAFKSAFFNGAKGLPLLRIRDVGKDRTECFYDGDYEPRYIVQAGDLIIGMDGDFKCACWTGPDALLNQRVCKIELITRNYEPSFLNLTLPGYLRAINERTSSQTVRHLSSQSIAEIPLPLPPLAEQKRIVSKVKELLARVNTAKGRLAKVSVILKRFRQAVLAAACSGRLTVGWREVNPSPTNYAEEELPLGWRTALVGEVIESLKYGTSQKCSYEKRGVPVLRIPNIEQGVINHSDLKYAELREKESQQLCLQSGDILMIRSNGSVSLVGRSALLRETDKDFAYAGYLIRLRPNVEKILPAFLNLVLGSHDVRIQIEVPARSTSGVHNINGEEVRALRFFLPPVGEQHEIVRRVEAMFKLAHAVEKRVEAATVRAQKVIQAILAKAFRGELVPTEAELASREGRSYESASELLSRIKSENKEKRKLKTGQLGS